MNSHYFLIGYTTTASAGGQDGWVVKIDVNGNTIFSKRFGGASDDGLYKAVKISPYRMIICGYVDGDGGGEKYANLYIVKMRDDGTVYFEKNYGTVGGTGNNQTNSCRNILMDNSGDLILAGYTYCFGAGLHDGVSIKADTTTGARIWTKSYGGSSEDGFNSTIKTNDGNFILSGNNRIDGSANSKSWIVKINSTGDVLWQKSYHQSTTVPNVASTVSTANDNGFIFAVNESGLRTNLIKVDATGSILWTKKFDGTGDEAINTVFTSSDNNYFIGSGQTNSYGSTDYDLMIIKTNLDGTLDSCCNVDATITVTTTAPTVTSQTQVTASTTYATAYTSNSSAITLTKTSYCEMLYLNSTGKTDVTCNGLNNGTATASVSSGLPTYTYSWTTVPVKTTPGVTGLSPGTYTVTVTDLIGCTKTSTVTITQPTVLTSSISSSTNVSCNGGANGSATVSPSGGTSPYTYSWNTSPVQTGATATGLTVGSYTCTITDSKGCTKTQTVSITQPTALSSSISSSTNVSCNGGTNGAATASASGGTPAYAYSWNTTPVQSTAAATGLGAGTYTCTITDNLGCTKTQTVTITQPTVLASSISSQTNVSCNGGTNGAATASASGGTPGYTYSWSTTPVQSSATATNLSAGTYTCTITDNRGCTKTQTVTINEPTILTSSISSQTNVSCNGSTNCSATVSASGGTPNYTYSWNTTPVQTGVTANNLASGSYTCTITDNLGCTKTQTVTITQSGTLTSSISSSTNVSCNGGANGTVTVSPSGGTPGYTYSWNTTPVQTNATANNLAAGTYTCTITDNLGCTKTQTATISQPTTLSSSISATTNVSCNAGSNGPLKENISGGTHGYTYSWNTTPVQTSATASNLSAGSYTCTITDNLGCTKTQSGTITQPTILSSSISASTNVSCFGGTNGTATVNPTGGTSPYSYSWNTSPLQTTAAATGLAAGSYTCTITDNLGCTTTQVASISQPTLLTSSITSSTNVFCYSGNNGSAQVSPLGGTAPYAYSWNTTPAQTTAIANNLTVGSYTCTITDNLGCTVTQLVTITQPTDMITGILSSSNVLCGGANGSATVGVTGGTPSYSYSWNTVPTQTTATATGLGAGVYTCTITDNLGCTKTQSVTINQPSTLTSNIISTTNVSCNGGTNGSATVTGLGGTPSYTYS